jgi:hypothetical protein
MTAFRKEPLAETVALALSSSDTKVRLLYLRQTQLQ